MGKLRVQTAFFYFKKQEGPSGVVAVHGGEQPLYGEGGGTMALKLRSYEVMKLEDSKVGIIHFII